MKINIFLKKGYPAITWITFLNYFICIHSEFFRQEKPVDAIYLNKYINLKITNSMLGIIWNKS